MPFLLTSLALLANSDILLVDFKGTDKNVTHSWYGCAHVPFSHSPDRCHCLGICRRTMNDVVMGGQSYSAARVENDVLNFTGACKVVDFLKTPGFITAVSTDYHPWSDISTCEGLEIRSRSYVSERGFRISFGNAHPVSKDFAYGYKANFTPSTNTFGSFKIPFSSFTDFCALLVNERKPCCSLVPIFHTRPYVCTQGMMRLARPSTCAKRIRCTAPMTRCSPT